MNFTHTLSPSTFYEVRFSQNYVDFGKINEWRYTTPGDDPVYWQAHRLYGRLGTDEEVKTNNWSKYAKIKIGDYWYDEAPKGYSRVNWRDITGFFRMESCAMEFDRSITRTYDLRGSLTSQVNRFNQIKVGIELGKDRIHQSFERVRLMSTETEIIKQHPWRGAVFAQDKLEFQGMIANVGLRVDFINRDEAIVLDGPNEDKVNGPYSKYLGVGMADSMSFLPMKSVGDLRWSPRLGISHPISENAKIFFNYGHFYKWPETLESYRIERTGSKGNMVTILGNPQLDPPRTVQYEVGYAHNLFDLIELGLTGYYKDVSDEISNIRMYFMDKNYYDFFVNNQYRDIRGIEIRADMRRGRFVSGWANYNYMVTSTGKYGFDRLYEDPRTTPRDVSSDITQPESRPILRVNLDFHTPPEFGPQLGGLFPLADINLNLLYTRREGEKFTWNPKGIPYVEDNMRWRAWQMVDLRFTKRLFKFKGIEPVFYIDVFNLFDTKNMIMPDIDYVSSTDTRIDEASSNWVWDPGGYWKNEFVEYMNSLDLDGGDKPGDWKGDHIKLPHSTFWTFLNKRDIFFGIRINFD